MYKVPSQTYLHTFILQPPSKRRCISKIESKQYDDEVEELRKEWKEPKPKKKKIRSLMNATYKRRRDWINESLPLVPEILQLFPPLRTSKYVSLRDHKTLPIVIYIRMHNV